MEKEEERERGRFIVTDIFLLLLFLCLMSLDLETSFTILKANI